MGNKLLLVFGVFVMLTISCRKEPKSDTDSNLSGIVKDIEGNIYNTVTIGSQVWMVENLKTTKYRNGDPLVYSITNIRRGDLSTGACCNYYNDAAIGKIYGKLYNWYAVSDSRNIAPAGWHVPSDAEWTTLTNYLNDNLGSSGSIAKALASKTDWYSDTGVGAVGTELLKNNSSGFTALPAGFRDDGLFYEFGEYSNWWSSTEEGELDAWVRRLGFNSTSLIRDYFYKQNGFSVRCIKDN